MHSGFWKPAAAGTVILLLALASACGPATPEPEMPTAEPSEVEALKPVSLGEGQELKVVATTNIVGDVVRNVGGDAIDLTTLMDIGVDPHSYVPTPADIAAIHDADVVFANGAGLETNLDKVFDNAGGQAARIHLSEGLTLLAGAGPDQGGDEHGHGDVDPHVWFDVQNVIAWTGLVEEALQRLDPASAESYGQNASEYVRQLEDLDTWVQEQIAQIPEANRKLITDHPAFGYLADRYGLEQVGAVYPISPSSEPSAQDIAALQDTIRTYDVPAVFAESTVNPKLAEQVARDTGIKLVSLYTGSLGEPGSGAETYLLLIRYDVNAIVDALK
jgi:manganese/iron transport system substrate-binding protein